jgi:hypothetical protein
LGSQFRIWRITNQPQSIWTQVRFAFHYHSGHKGIELRNLAFYLLFCCLFSVTFTITAEAEIQALWEKYYPRHSETEEQRIENQYPGKIIGKWPEKPEKLFFTDWSYRGTTYEILFSQKKELGRSIYGIALFARDIDRSITLERFERGGQGFHYSISQVVNWANAVLKGELKLNTNEEFNLLCSLMHHGAISIIKGKWVATDRIKHILGATAGLKRDLKINLNHERIHVIWDEDPNFKDKYIKKWNKLPEKNKEQILQNFKNYDRTNINQIIEEWAVYDNESDFELTRIKTNQITH